MSCVSLRKVQIPFDDFWSLKIKNCCWWFGSLNQIVHKSLSLKKKKKKAILYHLNTQLFLDAF